MNLSISGHHLEVTPSIRAYVTQKLDRIRRHFDQVVDMNALLSVDKLEQRAEVTIHLRGKEIYAQAVDADLYAAIDILADRLDRQVIKYKDKRQSHHHLSMKRELRATDPDALADEAASPS
jgi:putative sigma-54 modulation protein